MDSSAISPLITRQQAAANDLEIKNRRLFKNFSALVAVCETTQDVQAAVRTARKHRLTLSVLGEGRDWRGLALRDGGLVIDMSGMKNVKVDPLTRTVMVGGGATTSDLLRAIAQYDLAAVPGNFGTVGDNLIRAEIVLANGSCIVASDSQHPELLWALRSGGGNFGVVTELCIRLQPVNSFLSGFIFFDWSEAETVLHGYRRWCATRPDHLVNLVAIVPDSDGKPVLMLAPTWSGNPIQGEKIMADLQRLGTPISSKIAPASSLDMQTLIDGHVEDGHHYTAQTRSLKGLTPDAIAALIEAGTTITSTLSFILCHHFHHVWQEEFMVEIVAAWAPEAAAYTGKHRQWALNSSNALLPAAIPGEYPNKPDLREKRRISNAYGSNQSKLLNMTWSRQFDAHNVCLPASLRIPR